MIAPRLTVLPPRCAGVVGPIAPILAVMSFVNSCERLGFVVGDGLVFPAPVFKVSGHLAVVVATSLRLLSLAGGPLCIVAVGFLLT